jgi:toxoflavin synthase
MASQYDSIGSKYNVFKQLPTSIVETSNLHDALLPYLSMGGKPRVMDLACGTGYYSRKLLEWNASYVLGVDLSSGMIEVANQSLSESGKHHGSLKFMVGDALHLGKIEDELPFDIVIGAWLLNYSSCMEEMTQMFRTISANLKEGGVFVGITPHPTEDVDAFVQMTNDFQMERPGRWGVEVSFYEKLKSGEGWRTEVVGHGEHEVVFRNFHLRKSVYEKGARQGGMNGKIGWKEVKMPQQALERMGEEYWKDYFVKGPHIGILVVEK